MHPASHLDLGEQSRHNRSDADLESRPGEASGTDVGLASGRQREGNLRRFWVLPKLENKTKQKDRQAQSLKVRVFRKDKLTPTSHPTPG